MGSGPSICELNNKHFKIISKHDSIGFGFWCVHDFKPTYYMMEFKYNPPEFKKVAEIIISNLLFKKEIYKNIPIILHFGKNPYRDTLKGLNKFGKFFNNIYLPIFIGLGEKRINEFKTSLLLLKKFHLMQNRIIMFKKNSSLFRALILAYSLGYKKIVLCGFNLSGKYFYEIDKNKYNKKGMNLLEKKLFRSNHHRTNDPKHKTGGMVISDIIPVVYDTLLKPKSIKLLVGTNTSFFYPEFSLYEW